LETNGQISFLSKSDSCFPSAHTGLAANARAGECVE
jgi:hypothetical protein